MRRRDFMAGLAGAPAWLRLAWAQQRERTRRVGVFMNLTANDPEGQARLAAFHQRLGDLGWIMDRTVTIDYRWGVELSTSLCRRHCWRPPMR
jgi:hypothetical protein